MSLPPEMRCEQIEDREKEHRLETLAYRIQEAVKPKKKKGAENEKTN